MANDLFQVLMEGADFAGNTAMAVVSGAIGAAVTHAPGIVAGVGEAVAYGVSEANQAARDVGSEIASAVAPAAANPFAGLLAGVDLSWNQQPQAVAHEASFADLGDLGAQLGNFTQQRQTGMSMSM